MTCRDVADFLMAYIDGELAPERVAAFERHLAVCPSCVAYLHNYRRTVELGRRAFIRPEDPAESAVPAGLVRAILDARDGTGR